MLDEGDNDLARFLTYFIAALGRVEGIKATFGGATLGMLHASQPQPPPTEAVLTSLINEIAAIPDRTVLVLDDYHLIEARPIHDALTFLLGRLPPHTGPGGPLAAARSAGERRGMHLVIATREDPHLPLARLRARDQLTELRARDLRFTPSEAAEFLNQVMGLNLSAEDTAALETRTEGWIAFVLDYLVEEVLQQQPESVQTFLLRTSILDRLCGPLCDAVCSCGTDGPLDPSASGQETLEYLEHTNLFIVPLDNERHWYRYHRLFADLLRQRLHQQQLIWLRRTNFPSAGPGYTWPGETRPQHWRRWSQCAGRWRRRVGAAPRFQQIQAADVVVGRLLWPVFQSAGAPDELGLGIQDGRNGASIQLAGGDDRLGEHRLGLGEREALQGANDLHAVAIQVQQVGRHGIKII